jgi:hypothetical protein
MVARTTEAVARRRALLSRSDDGVSRIARAVGPRMSVGQSFVSPVVNTWRAKKGRGQVVVYVYDPYALRRAASAGWRKGPRHIYIALEPHKMLWMCLRVPPASSPREALHDALLRPPTDAMVSAVSAYVEYLDDDGSVEKRTHEMLADAKAGASRALGAYLHYDAPSHTPHNHDCNQIEYVGTTDTDRSPPIEFPCLL